MVREFHVQQVGTENPSLKNGPSKTRSCLSRGDLRFIVSVGRVSEASVCLKQRDSGISMTLESAKKFLKMLIQCA